MRLRRLRRGPRVSRRVFMTRSQPAGFHHSAAATISVLPRVFITPPQRLHARGQTRIEQWARLKKVLAPGTAAASDRGVPEIGIHSLTAP